MAYSKLAYLRDCKKESRGEKKEVEKGRKKVVETKVILICSLSGAEIIKSAFLLFYVGEKLFSP